jgi:hypothetical protein
MWGLCLSVGVGGGAIISGYIIEGVQPDIVACRLEKLTDYALLLRSRLELDICQPPLRTSIFN